MHLAKTHVLAAVTVSGLLSAGLLGVASASADSSTPTVKVNDQVLDSNGKATHQGCTFKLAFSGFEKGQPAKVVFEVPLDDAAKAALQAEAMQAEAKAKQAEADVAKA